MREKWVDVSKGIAIFLMVVGHSSIPEWLSNWIYSFHMPFFFFISGYCTSWSKGTFSDFLQRRFYTLFLPFLIYSVLNLVLYPIALQQNHLDYCQKILQNGWGGVALWFVPVFLISIIICRLTPQKLLLPAVLFFLFLGCIFDYCDSRFPWTLSSVPFATSIVIFARMTRCIIQNRLMPLCRKPLIYILLIGGG